MCGVYEVCVIGVFLCSVCCVNGVSACECLRVFVVCVVCLPCVVCVVWWVVCGVMVCCGWFAWLD